MTIIYNMILNVLGNGNAFSIERANTSILALEIYGNKVNTSLLLEVPKSIKYLYENESSYIKDLDYVVVTHAHHDHYGDLEGLIMRKEFIEKKNLTVILPEDVDVPINFLGDYKPKYVKVLHTSHYEDEKINLNFFSVDHSGIPTYGVKINFKKTNKSLGYSSDTRKVVIDKLKNCDILLHDCTGGDYHTSEEEVYREAVRYGVSQKTLCIHVNDNFKESSLKLADGTILF